MMTATFLNDWWEWLPQLLPGLWVSLKLTFASLGVGLPVGLLLAFALEAQSRTVRWVTLAFVEIGRGVPILVLIYLAYFGAPQAGLSLGPFLASMVAVGYSTAAYSSEIFRGGLLAVPRGQLDAARAIGLTPINQMRLVVVPQALRVVLPPLVGFSIIILQLTSIAFAIALPELMSRAYNTGNLTFKYLSALMLAAVLYACIAIPASHLVAWMERRRPLDGNRSHN